MKTLKYKVLSNEHNGLKAEFTNKKDAQSYASTQRRAGWSATVVDMRGPLKLEGRFIHCGETEL